MISRRHVLVDAGLLATMLLAARPVLADCGASDAAIFGWMINTDARVGSSPAPTIDAVVSLILADVQRVRFNATDVYIEATGIPSYPVGPFPDGNPNIPRDQNWLFRIPRVPQAAAAGTNVATGLGAIGVWTNGVVVFNAKDARSYQNEGQWNQNAVVVEAAGFDPYFGHPQMNGAYHHHQQPLGLLQQLGEDGINHSPLVGFGFDGHPIYGPHGFLNADGSGGVVRLRSSYRLRAITVRDTLPDGTLLPANLWGPPVDATYPLGYYVEDFEYVAGLGDLDEFNGRFAVTPEYPAGTYAYCTTTDASGASAYPYALGPQYFGVLVAGNRMQTVVVPAGTCTYSASCVEGDCPGACTDGLDDDDDGSTDCADADCAADPTCAGADADGDGHADAVDCAPLDAGAFAVPPEIPLLTVTAESGGSVVRLTWPDVTLLCGTSTVHDIASDFVSMLWSTRAVTAPCLAQGVVATTLTDTAIAPGDALYYLVRALNACGPPAGSGWGYGSDGISRAACP